MRKKYINNFLHPAYLGRIEKGDSEFLSYFDSNSNTRIVIVCNFKLNKIDVANAEHSTVSIYFFYCSGLFSLNGKHGT